MYEKEASKEAVSIVKEMLFLRNLTKRKKHVRYDINKN